MHNIEKNITYQFNNNVFIPYNTGVIVMDNICDDIYNDTLDAGILQAIQSSDFSNHHFFLDSFKNNDIYSYDYSFLGEKSHTVFRFINVECRQDTYAVIFVSSGAPMKLWVNYKLFSVFGSKKRLCVIALKKGINSLIMETYRTTKESTFLLRISGYSIETDRSNPNAMLIDNMFPASDFGYAKHFGNHLYKTNNKFVFAYYPDDDMHGIDDMADIEITDVFTNQIYLTQRFPVRKKQEIDTSNFDIKNEDEGNTLRATIKYVYSNGREKSECIPLYKSPTEERLGRVSKKASALFMSDTVTDYDKLALRQGHECINKFGRGLSAILAQATVLRNNIQSISDGDHLDDTVYSPGTKRVYFFNKMYNAVNYYRIYLPEDYSGNKRYPLIIIYSTLEYNDRAKFFQNYTYESVIAVDISMRGMTLGSYIGEAAIQVALEDLFSKYNIDMDRIYCTGASNGAGGTWAQLETFPDRFAGGYVVSGHPNLELLCNIENTKLLCLSSDADYMNNVAFKKPMKLLEHHPDCIPISAKQLSHQMLEYVWFKQQSFEQLLSARRNSYPDKIVYKSTSNRHRKAYWVEIHSIEDGKNEGTIEAEIKNNTIHIQCKDITGFTITVPPQLHDMDFEVTINGESVFLCKNSADPELHFIKHSDTAKDCFQRTYNYTPIQDLHKGYGLLDVYLDPLSIVIPQNSSDCIQSTAIAYSQPYCNGIIPKIYIQYPIVDYTELNNAVDNAERSYVLIDDGSDHPLLCDIRKNAKISCSASGWEYNGSVHHGKYCVQQIVNSPWNPSKNIHLISYNDDTMLKKNLFTRKLVIPSYSSGRHKYLNNDALIFDEAGYHGVLDYSCKLVCL